MAATSRWMHRSKDPIARYDACMTHSFPIYKHSYGLVTRIMRTSKLTMIPYMNKVSRSEKTLRSINWRAKRWLVTAPLMLTLILVLKETKPIEGRAWDSVSSTRWAFRGTQQVATCIYIIHWHLLEILCCPALVGGVRVSVKDSR